MSGAVWSSHEGDCARQYAFDDVIGLRRGTDIQGATLVHTVIIEMRDFNNPVYRYNLSAASADQTFAYLKMLFGEAALARHVEPVS